MPATSSRDLTGWPATLAIVCLTLLLRLPWIDGLGLHGDEDISTLAARGIVDGDLPRLPSGSLYLRAPLYHYLVAPLVATGVDWVPRLLSVLASAITAFLVVRLGRRLVGSSAALLGGIFYATSLTEIMLARTARMYALYELLALVALGLLYQFWRTGTVHAGLVAAGAVAVSMLTHTLGATLWVLGLLVIVRDVGWRTRLFATLATGLFAIGAKAIQTAERSVLRSGGQQVFEPPLAVDLEGIPSTLRAAVAADPFVFGTRALGELGFAGLVLLLFLLSFGYAWHACPAAVPVRRLLAALGVGLTLAAGGAHQLGVAATLCCLLIVSKRELFPEEDDRRLLIGAITSTVLAGVFWTLSAALSGYELHDVVFAFTRWPGRLARLFLWPPAIALLAAPGVVAILVRSWKGRATDGERFLVLAILLIATGRGLLTGRTHPRYLTDLWPLWGLLAGWSLAGLIRWLRGHLDPVAIRRAATISTGLVVALAFLLLPGTGPRSTFAYLRLSPGDTVATGFGRSFSVADVPDAAAWVRPRLGPEDRVVATDWLTTYYYLGRVDAWSRWQDWAIRSRLYDGVVREVYLGAEVLPDLDALERYAARGPTWVILGAMELGKGSRKLDPEVRAWLLQSEPTYIAGDGTTCVYHLDPLAPAP